MVYEGNFTRGDQFTTTSYYPKRDLLWVTSFIKRFTYRVLLKRIQLSPFRMYSDDGNSLFSNAYMLLDELNSTIYQSDLVSPIETIKDILNQFKAAIRDISIDIDESMKNKLEFYLSIIDSLNNLLNKYQVVYSQFHNKSIYQYTVRELQILNQFVLWKFVSNSENQHIYHNQITANLLAKLLEYDSLDRLEMVEFDKITDVDSLDRFAQIFNHHQVSAGLYTYALVFLPGIHIDQARNWIVKAFHHYAKIHDLLKKIDLNALYKVIKQDPNRDFNKTMLIFGRSALDYTKFITTIYKLLGDNWAINLSIPQLEVPPLTKTEYLTQHYQFFNTFHENVQSNSQLGFDTSPEYPHYNSMMMVIRQYVNLSKIFSGGIRSIESLSQEEIEALVYDQIEIITILDEISKSSHVESRMIHFLLDSLGNLLILVNLVGSLDNHYRLSLINLVPDYLTRYNLTQSHEILQMYVISKYNLLKKLGDDQGIDEHLDFVSNILQDIGIETEDSLMLRIIFLQISYSEDKLSVERLRKSLNDIIIQHIPKSQIDQVRIRDYILYLIADLEGESWDYPIHSISFNLWDWRTWLQPEINSDMRYIPVHSASWRVIRKVH